MRCGVNFAANPNTSSGSKSQRGKKTIASCSAKSLRM